jgi:cell surface protein SprA
MVEHSATGNTIYLSAVFSATWNLPINKIPLFDWITSNASYNSTYNWNRMAQIEGGGEIGNVATSMGAWQVDGQFNFETLYNKSNFLRDVNRRYVFQPNANPVKFQSKTYTQTVKLEKDKMLAVNHRLGSEKYSFKAVDKTGKPITLTHKPRNETTVEMPPAFDADSVLITIVSIDPNLQTPVQKVTGFVARTLMMVRRASVTYRESNSMVLPGFKHQAGILGQQNVNGTYAPGYAFAFGFHDDNTIEDAKVRVGC